jgi:hypothetical protein
MGVAVGDDPEETIIAIPLETYENKRDASTVGMANDPRLTTNDFF